MGGTIVNRLRAWVSEVNDSKLAIISDCQEAADEISRLTEENERLRGLVRSAYNEGFTEGIREYRTDSGGKPWYESRARSALSKGEGS